MFVCRVHSPMKNPNRQSHMNKYLKRVIVWGERTVLAKSTHTHLVYAMSRGASVSIVMSLLIMFLVPSKIAWHQEDKKMIILFIINGGRRSCLYHIIRKAKQPQDIKPKNKLQFLSHFRAKKIHFNVLHRPIDLLRSLDFALDSAVGNNSPVYACCTSIDQCTLHRYHFPGALIHLSN